MAEHDYHIAYDPQAGTPQRIELAYDCRTNNATLSPSLAVVDALAVAMDVDPTDPDELGVTLHEHIEPDALNQLCTMREPQGTSISFPVGDYQVTIDDGGLIIVQRLSR